MVAGPTNKARVASWLMMLEMDVKDAVRSESRERDFEIPKLSTDRLLIGLRGATIRLSRENSDLTRDFVVTSEDAEADGPPWRT